jgi:hypothetical protein
MRNVKVLSNPDQDFRNEIAKWTFLEEIRDPSAIRAGERFIKYSAIDRTWGVYTKSRVHLSKPRYCGVHNNVLSAAFAARSAMMV